MEGLATGTSFSKDWWLNPSLLVAAAVAGVIKTTQYDPVHANNTDDQRRRISQDITARDQVK